MAEKNKDYENISNVKKETIETLDFTQTVTIPEEEIEVLDFTQVLDVDAPKNISPSKRKRRKTFWSIFLVTCIFIFIITGVILVNWSLENKMTNNIMDVINEAAYEEVITTTTKNSVITTTKNEVITDYEKYANLDMINVNFDNLQNINEDTVGWLYVPGTEINYPFVHTGNNSYYLKHSFDRSSNKKGWVYLDYRNDIDNLSKNNIIYAHGLVNNQMFGSLRKVVRQSWAANKSNHIIKISTPNHNQLWQVFSTYTIEPESYYITTKFNSDESFDKFIETIKGRSFYDYGTMVTKEDKILTLSSCYDDKKRMVLHAKLISNEKK